MIYREVKQVVNGETPIFSERETEMRRDAAILRKARKIPDEQPLVCATVNCERVRAAGRRYCANCLAEIEALDRWSWDEKKGCRAERLRTYGLVLLFVGLMSTLAYNMWPQIWLVFELWLRS